MDLLISRLTLPFERYVRWGLVASGSLVALLCGFLMIRRTTGALSNPLTGEGLVFVTIIALAGCAAFRVSWLALDSGATAPRPVVWLALPSLSLVFLVAALTRSQTPLWAVGLLWLTTVASEVAWWLAGVRWGAWRSAPASESRSPQPVSSELQSDLDVEEEVALPTGVIQQLTRARSDSHGESLYGLVRAEFAPGELAQQVHVAFCPPFAERPKLQAFVVDGPAANVHVAQLESFGTRIELRLPSHARHEEHVVVEFEAVCDVSQPSRRGSSSPTAP